MWSEIQIRLPVSCLEGTSLSLTKPTLAGSKLASAGWVKKSLPVPPICTGKHQALDPFTDNVVVLKLQALPAKAALAEKFRRCGPRSYILASLVGRRDNLAAWAITLKSSRC